MLPRNETQDKKIVKTRGCFTHLKKVYIHQLLCKILDYVNPKELLEEQLNLIYAIV